MTEFAFAPPVLTATLSGGQPINGERMVDIILEGGPADIPREMRVPRSRLADTVLKIRRGCGYEHFECFDDDFGAADCGTLSFRWTSRTKIAE